MLISVVVTVTSRRSGAEKEGKNEQGQNCKGKKTRCVKKKLEYLEQKNTGLVIEDP